MRDAVGRVEHPDSVEKVAVFVDGANLYHSIKSYYKVVHESLSADGERVVSHKGDWDMGIVVDMMRLAEHADLYVLVSGDGDYVEAVEYLQSERGLRVEVVSAGQCTSQALLDVCDLHTDLADIPDLFRRTSKQAVGSQQSAIS